MIKIGRINDLTGLAFGKLTVLRDSGKRNKYHLVLWECQCSCENKTIKLIPSTYLTSGKTKSCGCLINDVAEKWRKRNVYDLSGEYGIGWTSNTNKEFYFDLEDYDKIKDYTWKENNHGYLVAKINSNKYIQFHRVVMDVTNRNIDVDHILHNLLDNRKLQLRLSTHQQNCCNVSLRIDNTSGVAGVGWDKSRNKWCASINFKEKRCSKRFKTFDEAVAQRKTWEQEFFGDFAYQEPPAEYLEELELN